MQNFAVAYLANRFFFRVGDFFRHWYMDGTRAFAARFMNTLERADRTFAVRVTARHILEPLYGDYTAIGRVLGPLFRAGRVIVGFFVYLFIAVVFLAAYAAWALIPPVLLYYAIRP